MRTIAGLKRLLIPIIVAPFLMAGYLACVQGDLRSAPMTGTSRRFKSRTTRSGR
jgi:hypothetical protein